MILYGCEREKHLAPLGQKGGKMMESISYATLKNQAEVLSAFTKRKYSITEVGQRVALFCEVDGETQQSSVELSKTELSFYMMGYKRGFVDGRE